MQMMFFYVFLFSFFLSLSLQNDLKKLTRIVPNAIKKLKICYHKNQINHILKIVFCFATWHGLSCVCLIVQQLITSVNL